MRFLLKQAQQMQAKLAETQASLRVEGTAGGELVKVTLTGTKELVGLSIAKDAMDPEDPSMLEDLLLAAFRDAGAKVDEAMKKQMGGLGAGLGLPGMGL